MKGSDKANNEGHKLQFRFSDDAVKRLHHLKDETLSASKAEVVRNALKVYEYLIDRMMLGFSIQLVKDGKAETIAPLSL